MFEDLIGKDVTIKVLDGNKIKVFFGVLKSIEDNFLKLKYPDSDKIKFINVSLVRDIDIGFHR